MLINKGCYEINVKKHNFFKYAVNKKVCINYDFKIDKYEVTYKKAIKYKCKINIPYFIKRLKKYNFPVYNVSYKEALECCKKMKGDLPTQKEWSVTGIIALKYFDFNNSFDDIVEVNKSKKTGDFYGLFGNVWEITKSSNSKVFLKGGSFIDKKVYFFNPLIQNVVLKKYLSSYGDVGFRCVYRK